MPRNGPSEIDVTVASQRRAQVIRAVLASIAAEGMEHTTMRSVAERAGVSTGTIAYYFGNKKEMVDAALLEATQQYMERFNREQQAEGTWSLDALVDNFLSPDNADAGFVLQMIEVGLHNPELRAAHQWMVDAGRAKIAEAIRQGIESGRFRSDLDPALAAAMLHGVLVWWGSELMSNATSPEMARRVGKLALSLLEVPAASTDGAAAPPASRRSAPDVVRAALAADPRLDPRQAGLLAAAFEQIYEAAAGP